MAGWAVSSACPRRPPWPIAIARAQELPAAVGRLGYESRVVHAEPGHPLRPVLERRAAELIVSAEGPAIVWGVQLPAFGLAAACGDREVLRISGLLDGRGGAETMATRHLGGGDVPVLFVLTLGERHGVDALASALEEALRLGQAAQTAYASWIAAFRPWKPPGPRGRAPPPRRPTPSKMPARPAICSSAWRTCRWAASRRRPIGAGASLRRASVAAFTPSSHASARPAPSSDTST